MARRQGSHSLISVAAYQAPLASARFPEALASVQRRVRYCEANEISILCCPEAFLGGLADYLDDRQDIAIPTDRIESALAPLASDRVTTIVGLSERAADGRLFNSAAMVQRGSLIGVYRKQHPAIRHSVYAAGAGQTVFHAAGLTFGVVICHDSTFPELVTLMASHGAAVLFVPTNNALPRSRSTEPGEVVAEARACDRERARENRMWIVRADVAGETDALRSMGSSSIVDPTGRVRVEGRPFEEDLLVAEIPLAATSRLSASPAPPATA